MADSKTDKAARPPQAKAAHPPRERKGWLTRLRPGVRSDIKKGDTPENLWVKDPESGEMLYRPDLEAALWVTPSGHHMRIGAAARLRFTFDDGQFERIASPNVVEDPLNFPDERPYKERLAAARKATGEQDSMAAGFGRVAGQPVVVIVQDFSFMGGSLGMGAGETFVKAAQEAVRREVPLVIFTASGGARMQEGTLSLMQMARTTLAVNEGRRPALCGGADRPDHRRGAGLLRHAGRHPPGRAQGDYRFFRPPGDRADHPRDPAAGLPEVGVPGRARHDRPRRRQGRHPGGARQYSRDPDDGARPPRGVT
jgi:hypothetical protein